jgi:hypothetical protein
VCDRANDRIQVFKKDGTFVREAAIARLQRFFYKGIANVPRLQGTPWPR